MTKFYWKRWAKEAFSDVDVKYIYWHATKRLEPQLSEIVNQFNGHIDSGHCKNGCLVFTHSTGGLVVDILLSRSYESRGKENDFSKIWDKTIASVNIASAGGGLNLVNKMGDLIMGNCSFVSAILLPFVECGEYTSIGAAYDLRPDEARLNNQSDHVRTPSLMIAGSGMCMPNLAKLSLLGVDDGLVSMQSACGGNRFPLSDALAPTSCSPILAADGELSPQQSSDLYWDHFPLIMTKEGHVSQLMRGGLNIDFISTKTETLVPYDENGQLQAKVQKKYSRISSLNVNKNSHLTDVVGDYFKLSTKPKSSSKITSETLTKEDFRQNMNAIARAFKKSLSYPFYSRPLSDRDFSLLNPNHANTMVHDFNDGEYSARIILPHYMIFHDSEIPISIEFKNTEDSTLPVFTAVDGEISNYSNDESNNFNFQLISSSTEKKVYQALIKPSKEEFSNWPEELNLKVSFKPENEKGKEITRMFKLIPSVAKIVSIKPTELNESNLVIPLDIQTIEPGDYKVTANLFSKETGKPIAHLTGKSLNIDGLSRVTLMAHSRILIEKNEPGPYILKNIMITKIPADFSEKWRFGDASEQEFELTGFDLEKYSNIEWQDEHDKNKYEQFQRFVSSLEEAS